MSKFYNFKNNNNATELYLYGAIVSEKWYEDDVSFTDFRDALEEINDNGVLNIYVNSPGGEVFVTDSIIAMIDRCKKKKNITIDCYIDGLGASCASWLPMVADNLYIYDQSVLMLHKPMSSLFGANANDMKKQIEVLDKIEESMVTMYLNKAKDGITEDKIKEMLSEETWLNSREIQDIFNVQVIESASKISACIDEELFKNYKNVPQNLIEDKANEENEAKLKAELELKNKILEIELALM